MTGAEQPSPLSLIRGDAARVGSRRPTDVEVEAQARRLEELVGELAEDHRRMLAVLDKAVARLAPAVEADRFAAVLDDAVGRVAGPPAPAHLATPDTGTSDDGASDDGASDDGTVDALARQTHETVEPGTTPTPTTARSANRPAWVANVIAGAIAAVILVIALVVVNLAG